MTRTLLMMLVLVSILVTWMQPMKQHMGMGQIPRVINILETWARNSVPSRMVLKMHPTTNILALN